MKSRPHQTKGEQTDHNTFKTKRKKLKQDKHERTRSTT